MMIQVQSGQVATSKGTLPDVKKVEVIIAPADKIDAQKPVQLQLQIHACFKIGRTNKNYIF